MILLALATAPAATAAQQPRPAEDPFARYLYPPELVLDHQRAIGLSDQARLSIQQAMLDAQKKFLGLQMMMGRETENLRNLLSVERIDESAVLKQIDAMLGVEREIKRSQLSLMIQIKNTLTPEQQATLDRVRDFRGEGAGIPGGPLVVLDGRPMRTGYDPRSLSRDDIESIEIVKGAAAERLYGAEGRHGVIVITTRKR
jgi:TonB-dependent SusC/RagA subfamily outer membrane receptor